MKDSNSQPDAEQYARVVLWHLAGIQATLQLMEAKAIKVRGLEVGASEIEILSETAKNAKIIDTLARQIYRESLQLSNIQPSPTFPNPPSA